MCFQFSKNQKNNNNTEQIKNGNSNLNDNQNGIIQNDNKIQI